MRVEGHSSPRFLGEGDRTKCGGGAYSLLPVTLQATFLDLFGCHEWLLVLCEEADALVVLLEELDDAQRCCAPIAIRLHLELDQLTPLCPSKSHSTGTSTGAPLSLIKNTRNFAGLVLLAFRSTT